MVHPSIDLSGDLVQRFPLELLSLEELLQHGFSFILRNSDRGGGSDLSVLVVLYLRLIALRLA